MCRWSSKRPCAISSRHSPSAIDEYEALLTSNPLLLDRTYGIGKLTGEECLNFGVTGPMLRASGVKWDLRKDRPYSGYEQYDFDVPTRTEGDVYARYLVRMEEMRQSLKIVEQALDKLPMGPVRSNNCKFVPPPRSEIGVSMEALIHHFKLWTEGFNAPQGIHLYCGRIAARRIGRVSSKSDGGPKPYRVHWRTPSFDNLQSLPLMAKGVLVADLVAIIGSVDIVLGDVDR